MNAWHFDSMKMQDIFLEIINDYTNNRNTHTSHMAERHVYHCHCSIANKRGRNPSCITITYVSTAIKRSRLYEVQQRQVRRHTKKKIGRKSLFEIQSNHDTKDTTKDETSHNTDQLV